MLQTKDGGLKLYKLFGRSSLLFLLVSLSLSGLSAKSFEDFKRSQSESFQSYIDERDESFSKYLQENWEAYNSIDPHTLYEEEKPSYIKPARFQNLKKIGPKIDVYVKALPKTKEKKAEITPTKEIQKEGLVFDYFGKTLEFIAPTEIYTARYSPQTQKGVKNFLDTVVSTDYEPFLKQILKIFQELNLNDWGKYLLIRKISEKIFPSQDNSRLLAGFIFNKLGYSIRIGLAHRHVLLMFHSEKIIYSTPSYTIDNKKFYLISNYAENNEGEVFTYKADYPQANKAFDLSMKVLPSLKKDIREKSLSFKQYGKKYDIKYKYNQNIIDFMATYPQADYETFFNTPLEKSTYYDIATSLRKHINGKRASVAINFVLNFVQNSFKYEVDSQQFGREKVMFAQETLYYDKSDCEDRAILFSYLVKELFNISVVGVKYKDHMSTALYIPMDGDSVKVKAKRFVIADPTYINATIGQNMPKYKTKRPKSFIYVKADK